MYTYVQLYPQIVPVPHYGWWLCHIMHPLRLLSPATQQSTRRFRKDSPFVTVTGSFRSSFSSWRNLGKKMEFSEFWREADEMASFIGNAGGRLRREETIFVCLVNNGVPNIWCLDGHFFAPILEYGHWTLQPWPAVERIPQTVSRKWLMFQHAEKPRIVSNDPYIPTVCRHGWYLPTVKQSPRPHDSDADSGNHQLRYSD